MTLDKRLDDLEASLSPDQIWLRFLDEMTSKFSSRAEYMRWVDQDPGKRLPFPTFDRELIPYASSKSLGKGSERTKKLTTAVGTLRFDYCLFTGVDQTVNLHSEPLAAFELKTSVRRLGDELLADSRPLRWVPVPLLQEPAATVRTALDNYVMPARDFAQLLSGWIRNSCSKNTPKWPPSPEQRLAMWKEIRHVLFKKDAIKWAYYVRLEPLLRSLGGASLVAGRWLDSRLMGAAELVGILGARGFRPQNPPDDHPLGSVQFVNKAGLPPSKQEWVDIGNQLESHFRQFKGTKQDIRGQGYVDIGDYRLWNGRAFKGEMKPEWGIDVAHWNRRLDSLGERRAEIAGVKLYHLRTPFSSSDFVVCEDEIEFARRSEMRSVLVEKVHGNGIGGVPRSWSLVRERLNDALINLLASRELVKQMEEQFEGHQFVFRETREQLARQIAFMENLVRGFNLISLDRAIRSNKAYSEGSQIELDSALISAKKRSEIMFKNVKLRAEALVLESLGHHEDAIKMITEANAANAYDAQVRPEEKYPASTSGAQVPPEATAPESPGPPLFDRLVAYGKELDRIMKAQEEEAND